MIKKLKDKKYDNDKNFKFLYQQKMKEEYNKQKNKDFCDTMEQCRLIEELHSSPVGGHFGIRKTLII